MPDAAKNDLKGLGYIGYTKEGLGQDVEAAACADKMLSIDGKYPAALNLKGVLAYKKGETEKAQDYFQKAIDADPGYGEAYTNLGVFYWGMDKKDEALAHLRKGFILSPTVPDVSSLYYSVISSLEAYSDAEADYRKASKLYPNNKNLAFLSIDILIQQGKFDEALIQIQDVLSSYGLDDGILNAALAVREKIGPLQIEKSSKKGTLSLCMIVKNEEKYLVQCFKSVRDIVDEMIIVDTGSTDKTIDIAKVFGAKLFDFPWTGDFAAARNHSLEQATGNWILILDGDEVLSPLDFKELKEIISKKSSSPAAYSIATRNYVTNVSVIGWVKTTGEYPEEAGTGWVVSKKVRLLTRNKAAVFSNPVHETLETSLAKANIPVHPCNIVVHHYGKLDAQKDLKKGEEYYLLGKIKHENDPTNAQYIIELARQAEVLGQHEEAIELWSKLVSLFQEPGWPLENPPPVAGSKSPTPRSAERSFI
jgi:tetratricopeptide (TPR) repeat protein